MPGGKYDPAAASVRFFGDPVSASSGADAFASKAASAIGTYEYVEPGWSTFNPKNGYCAEPVFTPAANTLKLKKRDAKQLGIYAKAKQDGGRATAARWTLLNSANAIFVPTASEARRPEHLLHGHRRPARRGGQGDGQIHLHRRRRGKDLDPADRAERGDQRNQPAPSTRASKTGDRYSTPPDNARLRAVHPGHLQPARGQLQTHRGALHLHGFRQSHGDRHRPVLDEGQRPVRRAQRKPVQCLRPAIRQQTALHLRLRSLL